MLFGYALKSLWQRRRTSVSAAFGIALVVVVLNGSLMLSSGMAAVFERAGREDVALFIKKNAVSEPLSFINRDELNAVLGAAERQGVDPAQVSREVVSTVILERTNGKDLASVTFRGADENAPRLRRAFKLVEGREPRPGADEALVGQAVRGAFRGLDLGGKVSLATSYNPTIVGVFSDGGSVYESEVWVERDRLATAMMVGTAISALRVQTRAATDVPVYQRAIASDKRIVLSVSTERTYFLEQAKNMVLMLKVIGAVLSVLMSLAAVMGAVITLLASVASRTREIGTLRAIGFSRGSILASVMSEAIFLSALGGLVGVLASLALTRVHVSLPTGNSEVSFQFHVDVVALAASVVVALGVGAAAGLVPAVRAARVRPIEALRG